MVSYPEKETGKAGNMQQIKQHTSKHLASTAQSTLDTKHAVLINTKLSYTSAFELKDLGAQSSLGGQYNKYIYLYFL